VAIDAKSAGMVSALLMFRRMIGAIRYAIREEAFLPVLSAGAALVLTGTVAYVLGEDWNVDALYFAVSTLTTTSVADPDLVLEEGWMKVFTIFYQLVGIGILVEVLRRFGFAFVAVRAKERAAEGAGTDG
jgi:Ion channel